METPGRRRRWAWVAAGIVLVLAAGAAVIVWQLRTGPDGGGGSAYVRAARPDWLPASWLKIADDEQDPSVIEGAAANGGTCTYESRGRLRVQRDIVDVSGCTAVPQLKAVSVRDVAVEAELTVRVGCAGMWVRTDGRGYFLAVCQDRSIRLHMLADGPASDSNLVTRVGPGFDPDRVVVGLLARGPNFTIYVDGQAQPAATDSDIPEGHIGVGGFAPAPDNVLDATIIQYRAWAPAATGSR